VFGKEKKRKIKRDRKGIKLNTDYKNFSETLSLIISAYSHKVI